MVVLACLFAPSSATAHGGGLNACGCHFNRTTGECHCHQWRGCGCECQSPSCDYAPEAKIAPAASSSTAAAVEPAASVCGVDRWPVKVLTDSSADKVRIDSPQTGTIEELRAVGTVFYASTKPRSPAEELVYTVEGWLAGYKLEPGDSDLHVVIKDDAGKSMIVEFPHPDCMEGSRVLKQAAEARAKFLGMLRTPPTTRYFPLRKQIRVRVTGVLFFDKVHNQKGVAPNGVELHPVIGIEKVP